MDLGAIAWRRAPPTDAEALIAAAAARQAASPAAGVQAQLPLAPVRTGAAFAAGVARDLARWGDRPWK